MDVALHKHRKENPTPSHPMTFHLKIATIMNSKSSFLPKGSCLPLLVIYKVPREEVIDTPMFRPHTRDRRFSIKSSESQANQMRFTKMAGCHDCQTTLALGDVGCTHLSHSRFQKSAISGKTTSIVAPPPPPTQCVTPLGETRMGLVDQRNLPPETSHLWRWGEGGITI